MRIREFDEHEDLNALRACVIELQDFERSIDLRRPSGVDIVDAYIPKLLERCKKCQGKILVAEADGEIVGYVMILTRVRSEDMEDGDVEYGLVADLVIREKFRKLGFGHGLLEAAEAHACARLDDASWIAVAWVDARNHPGDPLLQRGGRPRPGTLRGVHAEGRCGSHLRGRRQHRPDA